MAAKKQNNSSNIINKSYSNKAFIRKIPTFIKNLLCFLQGNDKRSAKTQYKQKFL